MSYLIISALLFCVLAFLIIRTKERNTPKTKTEMSLYEGYKPGSFRGQMVNPISATWQIIDFVWPFIVLIGLFYLGRYLHNTIMLWYYGS